MIATLSIFPPFGIELSLIALALIVLLWEAFAEGANRRAVTGSCLFVLAGLSAWSLYYLTSAMNTSAVADKLFLIQFLDFKGMLGFDGVSKLAKPFFLLAAAGAITIAYEYRSQMERGFSELVALILISTTGMIVLASANEFMTLFVALELITVSFYVMVSFQKRNPLSLEAGIKYLIIGAVSSAIMVYGIAFYFGTMRQTYFMIGVPVPLLTNFCLILILTGLCFKIAAVPFHMWAPDAYQGAPTPVTAFLATASKAAGFFILFRMLNAAFGFVGTVHVWAVLLMLLAALSMLLGNLSALPQSNLKRLMAYSGIGHTGFLLVGLATSNPAISLLGGPAVYFYLLSYLIASLVIFLVATIVSNVSKSSELSNFSGLAQRSPGLAFAMLIALASLAGIPPLAGFFGKFTILASLINMQDIPGLSIHFHGFDLGFWNLHLNPFVVPGTPLLIFAVLLIAIVSAVIGLYYYLGVIRLMYFGKIEDDRPLPFSSPAKLMLVLGTVATILLGICQGRVFDKASHLLSQFLNFGL
ncbi:MAG: NADH-quinone oxidoreductase subunit N [Verrucomicrobiae bacterium]|nr:NADH-quinone oxidoreductase subunit N [Verrucomicrobiae bacterium]